MLLCIAHSKLLRTHQVRPAVLEWAEAGRLPIPCGATTHDSYGRECLVWALSVVLSRAHAVNVKSACDKQLVMLPVIDMLNHRYFCILQ